MVIDTASLDALSCALILDSSRWRTPDAVAHCSCLCLGVEHQQADELVQSKATHSTIFLFDFNSYPLKEAFPKKPDLPLKPLQELQWIERCNIFLRDRFHFLPER